METIIKFLYESVRAGTPLLYGTTGEIITERTGSLNLGVEGMMAMGAIGGYLLACSSGSLIIGILFAFLFGALGALIYAFLTVTMQANQNVCGLALTIFGVGVYRYVGQTISKANSFPRLGEYPELSEAVADRGIPYLRDIPYIGKLLFSYNWFVYLGVVIAILCYIYVSKTRLGLRLRAIGENPAAADACGVNVSLMKYTNIILGGGICGIGGLYLGIVTNGGSWNDNWINGMGWISVALVIFAAWSTPLAILGAYFFGMLKTLQPWKGTLSAQFPGLLSWLDKIPNEFYQMLPFFITAVVLIVSSLKKKKNSAEPSHIGLNYFREER